MSKQYFIKQQNIQLSYRVIGKGSKNILCFHGYGQTSTVFLHVPTSLQETYTFYAFDLFFHGKSVWKSRINFLDMETWKVLLDEFLEKEKIKDFSLIGFSIGAKLVWTSLKVISNRVENIWLIAPDGIKANHLYVLATKTKFGRFLFKNILKGYPLLIFMNSFIAKYFSLKVEWLNKHLSSEEKRLKLFNTWLLFRKLQYSQSNLDDLLQEKATNTAIFASKNDRIIHYQPIESFVQNVKNITLTELDYSHPTMLRLFLKNDFQNILSK